jgi:hypothetical protein
MNLLQHPFVQLAVTLILSYFIVKKTLDVIQSVRRSDWNDLARHCIMLLLLGLALAALGVLTET